MSSTLFTPWHESTSHVCLDEGKVDLWRFSLADMTSLPAVLNLEEQQRAQRFRVPGKARAFVVARTRLRQILGRCLNIPPQEVRFTYNENGKPFLADDTEAQILFNLSHSGDLGLCAVSLDYELGVDLQKVDMKMAFEPLVERFFSVEENHWLQGCSEARRRRNFFRLWTRKEAWLKGKGGGFSESNLTLVPAHLAATSASADGWSIMNVPVARGYVGALALAGKVAQVKRWDWHT